MEYSKKIILITENNRIVTPIKHTLNKRSLEIASEYLNLHSPAVMRKVIARTGNTGFIRTELMRFIKEQGPPYAIIMDGQTNLGLGPEADPGRMKLFKTLLISYIILGKGKEFENLTGNFLLMTGGNSLEEKLHIGTEPFGVLNFLKTGNQAINSYIDELKQNREKFNERFVIRLLDSEISSDQISLSIQKFLQDITAKMATENPPPVEKSPVQVDEKPARIVFKIDDDSVYDDGSVTPATSDEYAAMKPGEIYLIGSWVAATELDVSKKIADVIQKGIPDKKRFSFNDAIVFHLDDRCLIDKNTALSVAQLFTKNLSAYKKISIIASDNNEKIIVKSRGYPMIKNMIATENSP